MVFISFALVFFLGFPLIHFLTGKKWAKVIGLITSSIAGFLGLLNFVDGLVNGFNHPSYMTSIISMTLVSSAGFLLCFKSTKKKSASIKNVIDSDTH